MSVCVTKSCRDAEIVEDGEHVDDESWRLPLAFNKLRHTTPIDGLNFVTNTWRMKERMKTVSVALVLCLNVGVDPPDIVKTQPCARLECWIDPLSMSPQKALETIGSNLQKQYERLQSRARYKQSLDPTVEEVKKLCTSLRRNAKEERVLFHYNGHGVPKPTTNGEIWVFNRTYTQYIPLSIYDLQTWMGAPSIYVYDCSNAGIIVEAFQQFAEQHEREYETEKQNLQNRAPGSPNVTVPSYKNCIQLAACQGNQILPMNPDLPADIFTSCLTTPIKIGLRWFLLQNSSKLVPKISIEHIDKIPGIMSDRKTVLGELNWILTAVTDTIAWNTLPRELFQKLFRQDLLVASLFRNYLLAERILRSYDCTPVSSPKLPPTYQHPMWQAWDMALDFYISKFPINPDCGEKFEHAPFFEDQLTAFEVWLTLASKNRNPPEQLPVILQVLLGQSHRLKALELLGRFLDLGPWAVNLALNVGIFPYILKLLQSSARELRSALVFIWAKILAVDNSCQADLVRDNGHKYFLSFLQDCTIPSESRLYAAFALACIVHDFPQGQNAALQGSLVSICLEQLGDPNPQLRQWLCLCLARLWHNYDKARWCGVRDIAHEKLYTLLQDPVPEVRASSVYALGTFINSVTKRSEHANNIDQIIAMTLINTVSYDMCPLVRKELVVALQWMVLHFEHSFVTLADKIAEENNRRELVVETLSPFGGMRRINSRDRLKMLPANSNSDSTDGNQERIIRVSSSSSISSLGLTSLSNLPKFAYGSIYVKLWNGLTSLDNDPHPNVANLSQKVTNYIRNQVKDTSYGKETVDGKLSSSLSLPPSPSNRTNYLSNSKGESPPATASSTTNLIRSSRSSAQAKIPRRPFPNTISEESDEGVEVKTPLVTTHFVDWCCAQFAQPVNYDSETELMKDIESKAHHERDWRFLRNKSVRLESRDEHVGAPHGKVDIQIFHTRSPQSPDTITFHPYEQHVAIGCKDYFGIWDWRTGSRLTYCPSRGPNKVSRITSLEFLNSHDIALLLAGSDDGSIRIWKNYYNLLGPTAEPTLLTAWQALNDVQVSKNSLGSAGLVTKWEQRTLTLAVAGDVRIVRIYDVETENKKNDIPTGTDCCTTCLDTDEIGNMMVIGCGDGSVRMFDRRLPTNDARVSTWREHSSWILDVSLRKCDNWRPLVVTGSSSGEIKYFDLRKNNAVNAIQTPLSISAFAIHEYSDVFACSVTNQNIHVYNFEGHHMNTIKVNEGFITNRSVSPVSCLSFHPYRVILAAGSIDNTIAAYTCEPRRRLLEI